MRNLKMIAAGLLAAVLMVGAGASAVCPGTVQAAENAGGEETAAAGSIEKTDETDGDRIESGGFDTPEEAITAFAGALQAGDLDGMVSTFAIETYCERYSLADLFQRTGALQPPLITGAAYSLTPAADSLMQQISAESRRAAVVNAIKMPLLSIAADKLAYTHGDDPLYRGLAEGISDSKPYTSDVRETAISELRDALTALQEIPDFSSMTVSAPIPMAAAALLTDHYLTASNLNSIFVQALVAGADGYTERGIILRNEEEIYIITMAIVKYGDRWYNYQLGGNIAQLMNISFQRQGIMGGNVQVISELNGGSPEEMQELETAISALTTFGAGASFALQQGMQESSAEFDQAHEELIAQLQTGRDEEGNLLDVAALDFTKPLIGQTDKLKSAADSSGIPFYGSSLSKLQVMTFDEMLEFFALQ